MEDSPNLYFMFCDRYEIQIQACVLFSNGNASFFNPHFHKNIFGNIQTYFENPELFFKQKHGGFAFQQIRKFSIFTSSDIKK